MCKSNRTGNRFNRRVRSSMRIDGAGEHWMEWALTFSRNSEATDINTDPGYGRAMDPDMALHCSVGTDNTMASVDSSYHANQPGPSSSKAFRHQHGHRLQSCPWASVWPLTHNQGHQARPWQLQDREPGQTWSQQYSGPSCRRGRRWPYRPPRVAWSLW